MSPLFDAYLVVDWSAASRPTLGRDSIWLCHRRRDGGEIVENIATRAEAEARIAALLRDDLAAGRSTLAGFDFPFGYPAGTAQRLKAGATWRDLWTLIESLVEDAPDNANNRFEVGATLNRRAGAPFPFWGCPAGRSDAALPARRACAADLRRLIEERVPAAQPVWKLAYRGAAGGQALLGIPVLARLRCRRGLAAAMRIWPFETGLGVPKRSARPRIVLAEVYPSLVLAPPATGEAKDRAQVRHLAAHFARLDATGRLAPLFAADAALDAAARRRVCEEEGWILGVTGPQRRFAYLRDPDAIYRRSFALVRAEPAFAAVPDELKPLALRIAHAAGDAGVLADLAASPGALAAGRAALAAGAPILVDCAMLAAGIARARLTHGNPILCTLADPRTAPRARRKRTTRSAAAVELWGARMKGAVVAIGNAPTALFRLIELVASGAPRPALVLGFPVGFVGAAESKEALAANACGLDFVTLAGRRGGSAIAAAAVNALAEAAR